MARSFQSIFSSADIEFLQTLPEVQEARQRLESSTSPHSMIYFSVQLTESIKQSLSEKFGLDLSTVSQVPMRWIRGDTASHVDRGASDFDTTYLVYLNTTDGTLIVDSNQYPIEENTGYTFSEGLSHKTLGTGQTSRLLLGPMNENGLAVGAAVTYFPTQADALAYTNLLGYGGYTVGTLDFGDLLGITSWRLASNSTGSSSQLVVYPNGSVLTSDGSYYLYPAIPCFLEGSKLLCLIDGKEEYVPIEEIRKGTLVKTSRDGFKKVEHIGYGTILNRADDERVEDRLYVCSKANYPDLTEDLILTGCHSILVDTLSEEEREATTKSLGKIFVTDKKYRLMACIDKRAQPWKKEGAFVIWHLALEHDDPRMNYGVYANGGLLVETCSKNFIVNKGNMTLL